MKQLILTTVWLFLVACSATSEPTVTAGVIERGDECHVCGMLIDRFPGPKGQAIFDNKVVKFCSTRDMVTFYQDEENTHRVSEVFVQDMAVNKWDAPNLSSFINGKTAWYVKDSSKQGGMGPTFASFSKKTDAQQFAQQFGGEVKAFTELHNDMQATKMAHHHH